MKLFEVVWKQNQESCLHCRETIYDHLWICLVYCMVYSHGLIDGQQYSSVSAAIAVHNFIAHLEGCRPMFARHQKTSDNILEMDMIRKLSYTFKLCFSRNYVFPGCQHVPSHILNWFVLAVSEDASEGMESWALALFGACWGRGKFNVPGVGDPQSRIRHQANQIQPDTRTKGDSVKKNNSKCCDLPVSMF